jgi:hypothetical protein
MLLPSTPVIVQALHVTSRSRAREDPPLQNAMLDVEQTMSLPAEESEKRTLPSMLARTPTRERSAPTLPTAVLDSKVVPSVN